VQAAIVAALSREPEPVNSSSPMFIAGPSFTAADERMEVAALDRPTEPDNSASRSE
jgi:hypothetical protein